MRLPTGLEPGQPVRARCANGPDGWDGGEDTVRPMTRAALIKGTVIAVVGAALFAMTVMLAVAVLVPEAVG